MRQSRSMRALMTVRLSAPGRDGSSSGTSRLTRVGHRCAPGDGQSLDDGQFASARAPGSAGYRCSVSHLRLPYDEDMRIGARVVTWTAETGLMRSSAKELRADRPGSPVAAVRRLVSSSSHGMPAVPRRAPSPLPYEPPRNGSISTGTSSLKSVRPIWGSVMPVVRRRCRRIAAEAGLARPARGLPPGRAWYRAYT